MFVSVYVIPVSEPDLRGNELKYVTDCVETGWVSSIGKYIPQFEQMFSLFCHVPYGVAVCNGTAALHLALVALGVKSGDEVIVPNLTFVATSNAVKYCGAIPVFADVDPETWTLDPKDLERRISAKTKAIIPVHLYGHACDMESILSTAKDHHLFVVEDCAEAHGALYKQEPVGSFGDVGCFSFYANKIITTGEGGMIVTKDKTLAERLAFLRDHAMSKTKKYWHPEVGFNYRMTNLQAALGVAQCERIENIIEQKRSHAQAYTTYLADCPYIMLPPEKNWAKNVYWMYSILLSENAPVNREIFMNMLREQEIDTRPFFCALSDLPPYAHGLNTSRDFPVSAYLSKQGLNLPSSVKLTVDEIKFICETIKKITGHATY